MHGVHIASVTLNFSIFCIKYSHMARPRLSTLPAFNQLLSIPFAVSYFMRSERSAQRAMYSYINHSIESSFLNRIGSDFSSPSASCWLRTVADGRSFKHTTENLRFHFSFHLFSLRFFLYFLLLTLRLFHICCSTVVAPSME